LEACSDIRVTDAKKLIVLNDSLFETDRSSISSESDMDLDSDIQCDINVITYILFELLLG
jgi:hypothetical protein